MTESNRIAAAALALPALLGFVACLIWPGITGPFLFDDAPNLQNLRELDGHFSRRSIGVYLSMFTGTPGRPLSALSFLINDNAWPSEPLGFKLTNLWIHLLNGVLVFGLARTLAHVGSRPGETSLRADAIALVCAAIWLLNPIQISAIFLTVQRMAQLAGTVMFAGLWGYAVLALRANSLARAFLALTVLGIATVLGVLAKENGILIPLLALVINITLLREPLARLSLNPARLLRYGVIAGNAVVVLAFAWKWKSITGFGNRDYDMAERLMTQGRAIADYVGMIIAPRLTGSSLYNDGFPISRSLFDPLTTLPAILLVASALIAGIALRKRMPMLSFGLLWYLAAHALESTVFPLEMYFEHRNYVPLFGPAFAIAAAALQVTGKLRLPALIGVTLWLLLSAGIIHLQAKAWGDRAMLATVWYLDRPNSLRAQQEYARYLHDSGRPQEAHQVLTDASRRDVSPADSRLQALAVECSGRGRLSPGEFDAVAHLLATEPLAPGTAMMLGRLRYQVQNQRCPDDVDAQDWLHLTQLAMENPRGRGLIRMLRMERAELFLAANELDAAIQEMDRAYRGRKKEPRIAFYAAALLASAGRYDEARAWAQRPQGQPWTWKRWLAQTEKQAQDLINAVDQSQAEDEARKVQQEFQLILKNRGRTSSAVGHITSTQHVQAPVAA